MQETAEITTKVYTQVKNAVEEFGLIQEGDRILIGLSGGKDSLLLTHCLSRIMKEKNNTFKVIAAHVKFDNLPYGIDAEYLHNFCVERDVEYHLINDNIRDAYLENDHKDTCIHCSRFRRSKLMEFCRLFNCNKLTLGHHLDDIVATLLMNMTHHRRFAGMAVKLDISVGEENYPITMIRPLAYTPEKDIIQFVQTNNFYPAKCRCPWGDTGVRSKTRTAVDTIVEKLGEQARLNIFKSQFNVVRKQRPVPETPENPNKPARKPTTDEVIDGTVAKGASGDIEDIGEK